MKSGIYKITNTVNGKFYIGSSKKIEERWDWHKQYLNGKYHINPKLQHAWDFYGEEKFIFEIVEEVEFSLLLEREQHYLDLLKPYEREIGYNICPTSCGGDNFTYNPRKEEIRQKLSNMFSGEKNGMFGKTHSEVAIKLQKEKSVGRYTLDWFIKRYGQKDGEVKFEKRRMVLSNRKPIINKAQKSFNFKGRKHTFDLKEKQNKTSLYFKTQWNSFVKLVKSNKYSQRQLSTMLDISRPTLRIKIKKVLEKQNGPAESLLGREF